MGFASSAAISARKEANLGVGSVLSEEKGCQMILQRAEERTR